MAAHVEFRQVQGRVTQGDDRHFFASAGHNGAGFVGASRQHRMALIARGDLGQGFTAFIDQRQLDFTQGFARFQRGGEHVSLFGMAAHMQANVSNVEVGDLKVPAKAAGRIHDRNINAGLLQFLDFLYRQKADVAPVRPAVSGVARHVNAVGHRLQLVKLVAANRAFKFAGGVLVAIVVIVVFFVFCNVAAFFSATHLLQKGG